MTNVYLIAGLVLLSLLIYWFLKPGRPRSLFLLSVSVLCAALAGPWHAFYFLFNIAVTYAASVLMDRHPGRRKTVLQMTLAWLIGNLFLLKYAAPNVWFPLGMSYISFRLIHFIVESYRGAVPKGSFWDFALYVLFFPTFLAGPIERFERFQPQTEAIDRFDLPEFNYGLYRLVRGMIKKFVIADAMGTVLTPLLASPQDHGRGILVLAVYGFSIRLYMDFSGYTDMAIGVARLFGYRIVENFDRPFFKKNIALFWRSWHISLYTWIRDYLFLPVFAYRASPVKVYVGIFCSMLAFMLWHEGTLSFLALGIYHGLGLVGWHLLQEAKRKFPVLKRALAQPFLDPVATFLTFSFVSFGLIFFRRDFGQAVFMIRYLVGYA